MARLVAQAVSEKLGQPVVVDNRAGAAGVVGTGLVAKAPADGYTVLVTGDGPITQAHLLVPVPYDPARDFMPLVKGAVVSTAVVVSANSPFKSFKALIDYARVNPGKVSWGTPGAGTSMHAELEMLKEGFGVDITHIPYKGAAQIMMDTIGEQVTVGTMGLPAAIGNIRSGKLRLLAVWGAQRAASFPDVPSVQEATGKSSLVGLPTWYGFLVPKGVPAEIASRLESEIIAALRNPEISRKLSEAGAVVVAEPSAKFQAENRKQTEFFAALFKSLNIKPE